MTCRRRRRLRGEHGANLEREVVKLNRLWSAKRGGWTILLQGFVFPEDLQRVMPPRSAHQHSPQIKLLILFF